MPMIHVPKIVAVPENWFRKPAQKWTMSYSLPETDTRKIQYQMACQTRQKPVPVFWYQFLVLISGWCDFAIITVCIFVCCHLGK